MRISDWSSDVCSSDLERPGQVDRGAAARREAAIEDVDAHVGVGQQGVAGAQHEEGGVHVEHALVQEDVADAEDIAQHHDGELQQHRSEEHTSELQSLMRTSYTDFCLKQNKQVKHNT